jgi:hypothetical protein
MCGKKSKRVVDHTLATWDKLAFDLIPVSGHGFMIAQKERSLHLLLAFVY